MKNLLLIAALISLTGLAQAEEVVAPVAPEKTKTDKLETGKVKDKKVAKKLTKKEDSEKIEKKSEPKSEPSKEVSPQPAAGH